MRFYLSYAAWIISSPLFAVHPFSHARGTDFSNCETDFVAKDGSYTLPDFEYVTDPLGETRNQGITSICFATTASQVFTAIVNRPNKEEADNLHQPFVPTFNASSNAYYLDKGLMAYRDGDFESFASGLKSDLSGGGDACTTFNFYQEHGACNASEFEFKEEKQLSDRFWLYYFINLPEFQTHLGLTQQVKKRLVELKCLDHADRLQRSDIYLIQHCAIDNLTKYLRQDAVDYIRNELYPTVKKVESAIQANQGELSSQDMEVDVYTDDRRKKAAVTATLVSPTQREAEQAVVDMQRNAEIGTSVAELVRGWQEREERELKGKNPFHQMQMREEEFHDARMGQYYGLLKELQLGFVFDFIVKPHERLFNMDTITRNFQDQCAERKFAPPSKGGIPIRYKCSRVPALENGWRFKIEMQNFIYSFFKEGLRNPDRQVLPLIVGTDVSFYKERQPECYFPSKDFGPKDEASAATYKREFIEDAFSKNGVNAPIAEKVYDVLLDRKHRCTPSVTGTAANKKTVEFATGGRHSFLLIGMKREHGICSYKFRDSSGVGLCENKQFVFPGQNSIHCEGNGDFWLEQGPYMRGITDIRAVTREQPATSPRTK